MNNDFAPFKAVTFPFSFIFGQNKPLKSGILLVNYSQLGFSLISGAGRVHRSRTKMRQAPGRQEPIILP